KPTHPELLDWLSAELVRPSVPVEESLVHGLKKGAIVQANAWSLKHIHRLLVTSATYRQSSGPRAREIAIDAAARLLWRFPPQRLEAEPLRDTILSLSG